MDDKQPELEGLLDALKPETALPLESLPPLCLAYIGDAVFELAVRSHLLKSGISSVKKLNASAFALVKAETQARFYHLLEDKLQEDELAAMKRGRNTKTNSHTKSATLGEYKHATGLEALFGYLYLSGRHSRIGELFSLCVESEAGDN